MPEDAHASPLPPPAVAEADAHAWYKDAIVYQLHIKAFFDANNDGMGDFHGLTSKLDYIAELGVNTIWLLPFYPSPLRDDGYDVADYTNVNPTYGTRADFQHFVREAHRRNLRVITELIINHTSDQHAWFQAARRAPAGSRKRDWYVWSDDPKRYSGTRIIFTDTEKSNWAWDDVAQAFYWHRFFSHQPDLNFDNPQVRKALFRVMRFWADMGVDGFRLDAIPYLCEREGTNNENLPETHEVLKEVRAQLDAHYQDKVLLAEANQWPEDVREYFGNDDECHMAYHFPLMPRMYMAMAQEDRHPIVEIMQQTPDIPPGCQWAIFLRNHDELTLEMVTSRERDYMYQMYAAEPRARLNLGIRRRLAPLLENDREKIKLMNSLLLSMPGSPILYYGDEIGMGDNIYAGDRDGVRTPMQWRAERNAGFSEADPQRLYLQPIMDPVYGYGAVNVERNCAIPRRCCTGCGGCSRCARARRRSVAARWRFSRPATGRFSRTCANTATRSSFASAISAARRSRSSSTLRATAGGFQSSSSAARRFRRSPTRRTCWRCRATASCGSACRRARTCRNGTIRAPPRRNSRSSCCSPDGTACSATASCRGASAWPKNCARNSSAKRCRPSFRPAAGLPARTSGSSASPWSIT
jgi:trehalose synthase